MYYFIQVQCDINYLFMIIFFINMLINIAIYKHQQYWLFYYKILLIIIILLQI